MTKISMAAKRKKTKALTSQKGVGWAKEFHMRDLNEDEYQFLCVDITVTWAFMSTWNFYVDMKIIHDNIMLEINHYIFLRGCFDRFQSN